MDEVYSLRMGSKINYPQQVKIKDKGVIQRLNMDSFIYSHMLKAFRRRTIRGLEETVIAALKSYQANVIIKDNCFSLTFEEFEYEGMIIFGDNGYHTVILTVAH